jgi:AraC-like DNA-binding protein
MSNPQMHVEKPFSFQAWRAAPMVMPGPHTHTDIELNLLLTGSATYFLAGRFHEVQSGRLVVFWAGMPHRLTEVAEGTEYYCMTLPLAWFLGWGIEGALPSRLLAGELVQEGEDAIRNRDDLERVGHWVADLKTQRSEPRRIALLEVEARLRRLALTVAGRPLGGTGAAGDPTQGRHMERIAEVVGKRYQEPLTVGEIAAAVGLNATYAMMVFRERCGLSLWEYVTRLRISHAQRLLLTTDWTVERIALDCGFGSPSRFFAAFRRLCACTPREYRRR